ncbi:MAG: tandem-95 repeat protein [Chloroflexi bacterium]|nr:tandem-95 repeat protein [Chloroflexota bacterium]
MPVATADAYSTDEDTPLNVAAPGVLGNDTDTETDPLTAIKVSDPANGAVTLNSDGSFIYTPNADYNGTDSFTYKANDTLADSNVVTVTITVNPVNDAPVAVDDSYSTDEDTPLTVAVPGVLGNDTDTETDPLTAIKVSDPANGAVTLNSDGSFIYTPNADYNGTDSFTYKANDTLADSNVVTVTITVNPINDAPVAVDDAYSTDEDTPLVVAIATGVLANDTDAETNPLTAVLVANVTNGTLLFAADGSFTYTPNANFNGTDTFTYLANDGTSDSATPAAVTITVNPINDAPVAVDDSYSTNEDVALVVNIATGVLANDSDVDLDTLTAELVTNVTNGTLALAADGSFTYTPNAGFNGSDSFTYNASDSVLDSNVATVTINVGAVNDAPVAVDDSYSTNEDAALVVNVATGVLVNDTDVDLDTLSAVLEVGPINGILNLNTDGSFTYTPAANFNGSDTFTYRASDGTLLSNVATVTITVNPVNDAPVAVDDSYSTNEDVALVVDIGTGVLANDTDVETDPLTAVKVSDPANGAVTFNSDGSFTYTPAAHFNGSDSFTYRANDGTADSNVATVTITVNPVNDAPVAVDDSYSTNEDVGLVVNVATGVLANDTDVEGSALTAQLVATTSNGTLSLSTNGGFTYTPAANFNGTDTFTYLANDGTANSAAPATVTITVNPVNDAPVAVDDSYATNEDVALIVNVATGVLVNDTDVDGNLLTAALVDGPTNGLLTLNANGSFTYTPAANFNGSDSFTYRANDGTADSNVATVTITVNPANDAPVAVNDAYATDEDVVLNVPADGVLTNDSDADGNPLNALLAVGPTNGVLTLNANGSFTYTPAANFNGSDSFTYRANDGAVDSNVATVTITVNPVNDAPVAADNGYNVNEDGVLNIAAPGILANDTDVEGSALTAQLVATTTNGTLSLNADGAFTYTPAANFNGSDSFTYRASDGTLLSNIATVSITVNPVNDAPVAVNNGYNVNEDAVISVDAPGILANDTDIDLDPLTAVLATGPTNGVLNLNSDGSFTYTPNANFNGSDSFTYSANDGTADSNIATVTITVNPVNDAPVAVGDAYTTDEDVALNVPADGVLTNDSDVDGNPLTAVLVTGPASGSLLLNPDGSFTYTPAANFNGSVNFTYRANDGIANSNIATVTITVNPVNDAPVAVSDAYSTDEDVALNVAALGVLDNDTDIDGNPLTAIKVTDPSSGTVTVNADGSFIYTPNANFNGSDSFTYRANDGTADSNIATVTITVNAVNDAPVAVDDSYSTDEDVVLNIPASGVLGNDSDTEASPLTAQVVDAPNNGGLTLNTDGSFTYTPNANFNGSDSFTYVASDSVADSNVATVTITVNPVNDAPIAVNDGYSTDEDVALIVPATGVLGNDTDVDLDLLTAVLVSTTSNGTLLLNSDGSFTYTPDTDYLGVDTFTYRANDGTVNSNIATVTISIGGVNDAPVAVDDSYSTNEDVVLTVLVPGVLGNDSDVDLDPLTAQVVDTPDHGSLTLNPNGSFTYTPNANYNGPDSFTYVASDGLLTSNVATVAITVNPVNDAPVAQNNGYNVNEDAVLTIAAPGILANDNDVEGSTLTAQLVATTTNGTLSLNANGGFTYTPNSNYNGPDSFTYRASDGSLLSNVATVTITVNPVNDAPVAVADSYATDEDTQLSIAAPGVLGNDTDIDGNPLSAVLAAGPAHGSLTLNPNGSFTYTPNADFNGSDSFTYRANDGSVNSPVATVSITVDPVNDPPVAVNDGYTTNEDTALTVPAVGVLTNDSDIDGNPLNAALVSGPAHGSLTLNPDGSFTYTPSANYNGSDSFTYRANDGAADSNVATVTITIDPVNDAPVAVNNSYTTNEDTALNIAAPGVLGNDTDVDGNPLTAILSTGPAHGSLTLNPNGSFTYTPNADYNGSDSFSYRANDGVLNSNVATVNITVNAVNDPPVAVNNSYSTDEDTALNVTAPGVLGNDSDIEGSALTAVLATGPAHGSLTLNPNGSFTYTPNANYNGSDSFTYRASDGQLQSNIATVTITVNPINDAPVAVDDSYSMTEDTTLIEPNPGVLTNDSDVDGNSLTVQLVAPPSFGSLTLTITGGFTYTPLPDFNGSDSFTYRATDGSLQSNVATVFISVGNATEIPDANNDSYSTNEDTVLNVTAPGVLGNDVDGDGLPLTAILVSGPAHGGLTLNLNGSFTYTPSTNYNGPDSFTYRADNGTFTSNIATVSITVNAVNDAPTAGADAYATDEDTPLIVAAPGVLGNDTDVENSALSAAVVANPIHGSLALNADGGFTYTPNANYNGPDSFTYRASDGSLQSNVATVSITVNPVNDAPVAVDDSYTASEDTALVIAAPGVLVNDSDVDGNSLTVVLDIGPANGSLTLNPNGSFTYTPNADYLGPDSFTYHANDGTVDSNVATVSLTVNPVSPPEFFLQNAGFEIPGLTLTRADSWDATASSNAKRKCNKDKDGDGTADKLFANSGECSLQVRGQATLTSKATQGFAFINFDLGDTVEMSAFIRANNLVGDGQIALIIDHVEGTKDKLKIFVPTGTYDYVLQTVSLVTTGTPIDMKIQIKLGTGAGKYWVDDIELIGFDTSARSTTLPVPDVLPVPDAAAPGWRG